MSECIMPTKDRTTCAVHHCTISMDPAISTDVELLVGICGHHLECPQCGTRPLIKDTDHVFCCSKCDLRWRILEGGKPLLVNRLLERWCSIRGALQRADFHWSTGCIVRDTEPRSFLEFKGVVDPQDMSTESYTPLSSMPYSDDPTFDQTFATVPTNWIAQDATFLYLPEVRGGGDVVCRRLLRNIEQYVPGVVVVQALTVTTNVNSPEHQKLRAIVDHLEICR